MMSGFIRATKQQAKLRMALTGPSGSGKTFTALIFAQALAERAGGRVALIDTEHASASKYADLFDFDVLVLEDFHPQRYIEGIKAAEEAGYPVLVIDSLSHAWEGEGGVLDLHEQETKREKSGNSFTAWRNVTPIHRRLVETILRSKCHIIATMRSKMEYVQTQDERGRTVIKRVGMAPVQRQGVEYEFDIVGDLDIEHTMVISKTRCHAVADAVVSKPDAHWFSTIMGWLEEGIPQSQPEDGPELHWAQRADVLARFWPWTERIGLSNADVHRALGVEHLRDYPGTMKDARAQIERWVANGETD